MSELPRRFLRAALYVLPVVLWMLVILAGSSTLGVYANSMKLIARVVELLTPEYAPIPKTVSGVALSLDMYRVNDAFRRVAHVAVYAILAALLVRAIQSGNPRLKPASLIGTILLSLLYVGVDELYRSHTPQRDAKWADLYLNLIGVAAVLTGTVAWFGVKALERKAAATASPTFESPVPKILNLPKIKESE